MIKAGLCKTAKRDFLAGVHQPDDTYCIALYGSDADVTPETRQYAASGEASGVGYDRGGQVLRGYVSGETDAGGGYIGWTTDAVWPNSTLKARGALVYNRSKQSRAVAVLDFRAEITSTAGEFRVCLSKTGGTLVVIP